MNLTVAHVYPDLLNLYGDSGNVLCIQKRCEWHGIKCIVRNFEAGSQFDFSDCDVVFIGGGQDREQQLVLQCLGAKNARKLAEAVENKTVLAVCGGYQLLGKYYETAEGARLDFTGILDFYTVGREKRLIGNYEFKTKEKIRLIGFENHSGRTYLGPSAEPLGKVIKGFGNNGTDKTEGVRYKSTFCTYAHGPLLPKNPDFADMLITSALQRKYGEISLAPLDCKTEILARRQIRDLYI